MPDATPPTPAVCPTCGSLVRSFYTWDSFKGGCLSHGKHDPWHDTAADPTPKEASCEDTTAPTAHVQAATNTTNVTPAADDEPSFTDEECPAWNHSEDKGFDQYVVCLRCDHFQDDCPHECGPEFSFRDVAGVLEYDRATIDALTTQVESLEAEREALRAVVAEADEETLRIMDGEGLERLADAIRAALDTTDHAEEGE